MSRRAFVQVKINSTDITGDISGDVLSVSYTDNASDDADDISILIQNRSKKWLYSWQPQEGAKLNAKIITERWGGRLNCGNFIIDDVSQSGWPMQTDIKAIAMPVDSEFSGVKRNKTWSQATIKEIASYIADKNGIPLVYSTEYNPVIEFTSQTDQSDKEFLCSFCEKYGLTMKLYSTRIVIYDIIEMESKKAITTLHPEDMKSFSAHSTIADTGYTACVVKYTTKNGQTLEHKYEIGGKTKKVYKHTEDVGSLAEAQRVARAKLWELNRVQTTFGCELMGTPRLVSAVCVNIKGFGNFDGKYIVDKSTHSIGGGYSTSLEMHKVVPDFADKTDQDDNINIGDTVQFLGGNHFVSSVATTPTGGNRTAGPAKVTNIAKGALHPYHLIASPGSSNVYGWVDASQVSK